MEPQRLCLPTEGIKRHSERGRVRGPRCAKQSLWSKGVFEAMRTEKRQERGAGPDDVETWPYTVGVWTKRMKRREKTVRYSYSCLYKYRDLTTRDSLIAKFKTIS